MKGIDANVLIEDKAIYIQSDDKTIEDIIDSVKNEADTPALVLKDRATGEEYEYCLISLVDCKLDIDAIRRLRKVSVPA